MTMQYIERINPSKCRNVALGGCITTGFDFFSLEKKDEIKATNVLSRQ